MAELRPLRNFTQGFFLTVIVVTLIFAGGVLNAHYLRGDMQSLITSVQQSAAFVNSLILVLSLFSCTLAGFLLLRVRSIGDFIRFLGGATAAILVAIVYYQGDSAALENLIRTSERLLDATLCTIFNVSCQA